MMAAGGNLVLNGVALLQKDHVRSLGVLLDTSLLLDKQVKVAARIALSQLWLVRHVRPYLMRRDLATVTCTLVTPRLYNCSLPYAGLLLGMSWQLHLVQNTAVDGN